MVKINYARIFLILELVFIVVVSLSLASKLGLAAPPGQEIIFNISLSNESGLIVGGGVCSGSVFDRNNLVLLVNNVNMSSSGAGWFWLNYTPLTNGVYVESAECVFGDEVASYFGDVSVGAPPAMGSGSNPYGGVTPIVGYKNYSLVDDFDKTVVDLRKITVVKVRAYYSWGSDGVSADKATIRVLDDSDEIVRSGSLNNSYVGVYDSKIDLEGLKPGDYTLVLSFDYKTNKHSFKIIDGTTSLKDTLANGKLGVTGIVFIGIACILLIILLIIVLRNRGKKKYNNQRD
jgi:hypothetical protein